MGADGSFGGFSADLCRNRNGIPQFVAQGPTTYSGALFGTRHGVTYPARRLQAVTSMHKDHYENLYCGTVAVLRILARSRGQPNSAGRRKDLHAAAADGPVRPAPCRVLRRPVQADRPGGMGHRTSPCVRRHGASFSGGARPHYPVLLAAERRRPWMVCDVGAGDRFVREHCAGSAAPPLRVSVKCGVIQPCALPRDCA